MKHLLVTLTLALIALVSVPQKTFAATPQYVKLDNQNTTCSLYVYVYAIDPGTMTVHQSALITLPPSSVLEFNMFTGSYTSMTWSSSTPDPYAEFYAVEFFEYDPTDPSCNVGPATPMSSPPCSMVSNIMDVAGNNNACMEASGSNCGSCPANTTINGNVYGYYYGNMVATFN